MRKIFSLIAAAAAGGGVAVSTAVASGNMTSFTMSFDVPFFNITNTGNPDVGSQMKLTVSDVMGDPTKTDFYFQNLVGVNSSVKEVYIDAGSLGRIFTGGSVQGQNGATFVWGSGSAPALPGASSLSPAFDTTFSLLSDSGSGGPATGLDTSSDWLLLRLNLAAGKSFADVMSGFKTVAPGVDGNIRVGLDVIGIGKQGGSDSYVSTFVVPLPPAAWAGLTCLAGVIGVGVIRAQRNARGG